MHFCLLISYYLYNNRIPYNNNRIPSCCATVSPVRLRDLDLLQAAYQETGPVPPALPSQSSPCQLEGTCAKPGDPSLG